MNHTTELRFVFEAVPSSPDLILVEVENLAGKSVAVGTWENYESKGRMYSALRLRVATEDILAVNE